VTLVVRVALAFALCVAVTVAEAGSLSSAQVAALCANAEDTSHCGRLIEEQQLKRFAGIASRDGDALRVTLYPRGDVVFRDVIRPTAVESYTLWDVLPEINAVLVFVDQGDRSSYLLLMRTSGKQFRLPAEPVLSPDRQSLATADFCASGCDNEVAVWRVSRDDVRKERLFQAPAPWSDVTVEWAGPDTVAIEYVVAGQAQRQQMQVSRSDARWRLVR
jgi:hypothetical protein